MASATKIELIAGLIAGIESRHWRRWSDSRKSLAVRICQLRKAGFIIESEPVGAPARNGRPPVRYRLVDFKPNGARA